ncbi:MAG: dienelactone hydrolase family protein [Pelolinea sp.]|nr:dienelactone hydrolase family protein [Pelolinea sp.]
MKKPQVFVLLLGLMISACAPVAQVPSSENATSKATLPVIVQPTLTASPDAASLYSLEALASREYGQGELTIEYPWHNEKEFTRYYITYDSDGLIIHGFVNIPKGKGPFPVVIALHGYISASEYETLDYSTRYADAIAQNGYIVLHPNMRNFPPSDSPGRIRDFQAGYVIDVLNLLAYVRKEAGQKGSLFENADLSRMGIWGHSLGGGVALRVTNLVPEIKAAVLYGAVSQRYTNDSAGFNVYDLTATDAAFSVHHGTADTTIDVSWSKRLCEQFEEAGREHECFFYEDAPHTFLRQGNDDPLLIRRTVDFFNRLLKTR